MLTLAWTAPAAAQRPTPSPTGTDDLAAKAARVDSILADYCDDKTPGALVAIVRGGEIVFQRAYGMANLTHGIPMTLETRTNIGSTSKQFTGFALALLESRGRLSLDDDVRTYVPELPDLGETVTLRHLLTHTTGYREFLNAVAIGGWRIEDSDYIDRDEIVRIVQRQPKLQNSPGAEWNYNNTAYALAALVVEKVTGETFPDWMAENVFAPIGMKSTLVRSDPRQIVPNSAQGYAPNEAEGFREVQDLASSMGAGGIYTTVGDLARWIRNLRTAEVGGEAVMEKMTTRYVLTTGDTTDYALGLMIGRNRGQRIIQHGGADTAHRSHFSYYPDLDAGVIVQSNNASFAGSIAARITEVFLGDHLEADPTQVAAEDGEFDPDSIDAAVLDALVGRFELEIMPGFHLTFRRDGDRLKAQATGQPEFELVATSDSTFRIAAVDASVTFHRAEDGAVDRLTLHQNGNHAARRVSEAPVAGPDLTPFVGRYYSEEFETFYEAALEDDALVLRHRRRGSVTLTHREDAAFTGTFPLLTIEFERDEAGNVTGFRASNGRTRGVLFERVR